MELSFGEKGKYAISCETMMSVLNTIETIDFCCYRSSYADYSYFISRLFVHQTFLKEDEPNESRKGAEKEPKRSRKKTGDIKPVSKESYDDTDGAYES